MRAFQEHTSELKQQEQAWALEWQLFLGALSTILQPPPGLAGSTGKGQQLQCFLTPLKSASWKAQIHREDKLSSLELLGHIQQVRLWALLSLLYQLSQPAEYLQ